MSKQRIVIVDYGMGNLHSVWRKLKRLDIDVVLSDDFNAFQNADKILLPGVGHFGKAMNNLKRRRLLGPLQEAVLVHKKPVLGICLGMQLMANHSEEGHAKGLGWVDAKVVRMKIHDSLRYKTPHTGWNTLQYMKESILWQDLNNDAEMYFVHSYHVVCNNSEDVLSTTNYPDSFVSAFEHKHIFGVQFHPEKSHFQGEKLLQNFLAI